MEEAEDALMDMQKQVGLKEQEMLELEEQMKFIKQSKSAVEEKLIKLESTQKREVVQLRTSLL